MEKVSKQEKNEGRVISHASLDFVQMPFSREVKENNYTISNLGNVGTAASLMPGFG